MPELLSPAKNLITGIAAINSGADAVYIGAGRFGARAAAGNNVQDIRELAAYAHQFFCKVYVTVNTLLYEHELEEAQKLIWQVYEAGADAIIIQDPGILMMNLPPIAVHASTQMHNNTPQRVKFISDAGVSRVVLARELSLEQIKEIKASTSVELEAFIHGSLCVSYSGRCYLSETIGGRSANRGECAQPCRNSYDLVDEAGKVIIRDKHLLSLRDLNLGTHLGALIDAGIASFKIEGRLKDVDYVKNVTAYYNQLLNKEISAKPGLKRASSGYSIAKFIPDPDRTFNRGFTQYFNSGRSETVTNHASPKSAGHYLGKVTSVRGKEVEIVLADHYKPANGDGLCWYDKSGKLDGSRINSVSGNIVSLNSTGDLRIGMKVYRNYNKAFSEMLVREDSTVRKLDIKLQLTSSSVGLVLKGTDEDSIETTIEVSTEKIVAKTPDPGNHKIKEQLSKSGNTIFNVTEVSVVLEGDWFFPSSFLNNLRRELLDKAVENRISFYNTHLRIGSSRVNKENTMQSAEYANDPLTGKENISNSLAAEFYRKHTSIAPEDLAIQKEFITNKADQPGALMTTKMCLKYELGKCPTHQKHDPDFPKTVYLSNKDGRFRLDFDCRECVMRLYKG